MRGSLSFLSGVVAVVLNDRVGEGRCRLVEDSMVREETQDAMMSIEVPNLVSDTSGTRGNCSQVSRLSFASVFLTGVAVAG